MDPQRWQRLEELFHAAAELPRDEREEYLRSAESDASLRTEVLRLLEADADPATVAPGMTERLSEMARTVSGGVGLEGRRIGPYRVLRRIGQGGMGTVWLAERDDVEKRVALKLVRGALAAPELVQRFLLERRVLARLEHPYIARLLDAGVTDDETPWFALEYVEGTPITDYCRDRDLPVPDRLRLFRTVCEAVSYAHANLVVHRDIKPSNVMITEDGTVKLLDFGIAKLLGDDELDATLTRTGVRVMSPAYAAPEQLAGQPITTATDVYSLGVLLHELLTGRRLTPVDTEGSGADRGYVDPSPPSKVAADAGESDLAAELAGDLDAICLRAMAAEPERRYRSAEQLRDDTSRHLTGLPVEARLPTLRYRAGKFVRRHAAAIGGAAVLALSLGTGLGAAVWQGQRAERARVDAEQARAQTEVALERSRSVSEFLIDLFQEADPRRSRGEEVTAVELVERGMERIDELDHDPVLQALLLENLAHVNIQLGRYDEASALAGRAVDLRRPLPPDSSFVTALNALGMTYNQRGLPDSAVAVYHEALPASRDVFGETHDETLSLLNNLAVVYGRLGRDEEAETTLRELIELERAAIPDDPVRSYALNNLGIQLANEGEFEEAEVLLRESLELRDDGEPDLGLANSVDNLGMVLREAGRYDDAEPLARRGMEIRREILGEEHRWFGESLFSLGTLLVMRGAPQERAEARRMLEGALDIFTEQLGPDHPAAAYVLHSLGVVEEGAGNLEAADRRLRQALAIRTAADRDNAAVTVKTLAALARVLRARGRADEAVAAAERAVELARSELDPDHVERTQARAELGLALAAAGRAGGEHLRAGLSRLAERVGSDHPRVRRACADVPDLGIEPPHVCGA